VTSPNLSGVVAARNIAIVLLLAAAVHFLPGGGSAAGVVGRILSTLIIASFVGLAGRWLFDHRMDLDSLGERWRLVFYGSIALFVFAMAARERLFAVSGGGAIWAVCLGAAAYGLYQVWRRWRQYA
jgi:hypothetical protein